MPLGWERINSRRSAPNKNIVFIKPLRGPTESTAKDFLERIAAQCLPITNKHYISVASLEEYEPNVSFWGRNFNNGEVIQLVLRSPSSGRWLPFKFVQMVMMHELAHSFWKVRNEFSDQMKELWGKGYTGEGLWGRGVLLENGAFAREELSEGEILPEHMCGGTFRSRGGRKRKSKPKITYKERQERRIKKKFGTNGVALGADEESKVKLEGKKMGVKPRVAGSARGRELRAAAALARFEVKAEEVKEEELVTDSEPESDTDVDVRIKAEQDDAVDIDGQRLLGWVKVCEDENGDDDSTKNELRELQNIKAEPPSSPSSKPNRLPKRTFVLPESQQSNLKPPLSLHPTAASSTSSPPPHTSTLATKPPFLESTGVPRSIPSTREAPCPVCSMSNKPTALTCTVCSHVLKADFVPGSWRCESLSCKDSAYINAGDVGICGVCGSRKCSD